jgi:hypothetical protein
MSAEFLTSFRREIGASIGRLHRKELAVARRETAMFRHGADHRAPFRKPIEVGESYADLTVEKILGRKPGSTNHGIYVLCRCSCGGRSGPGWRIVRADNLRTWRTTSCGCFYSYRVGRWRESYPPGSGSRGRYATYVVDEGALLTE